MDPRTPRPNNGSSVPLPPVVATPYRQDMPDRIAVIDAFHGIVTRPLTQQVTMQLVPAGFAPAGNSGLRMYIGHPYPGAPEQGSADGPLDQPFGVIDSDAFMSTLRAQGLPR